MQAQPTLASPRWSFSFFIALLATLIAAVLALALVTSVHPASLPEASTVAVVHEQAPDAVERNTVQEAGQSTQHDQAPDAKERNDKR